MEHLNLRAVRAAYIHHVKAGGERAILPPPEPHTGRSKLYASDLGGCHRKAMLRATDAKKRPVLPETDDNKTMKFFVGDTVHDLTYYALEWAGLLVCCEERVEFPSPMGGRLDCIYYDHVADLFVLWDGKTCRSNQLSDYRFELPKPEGVAQISGYADRVEHDICCLEYIDQAGTNSPEPCFFIAEPGYSNAEIDQLFAELSALPDLPPILPLAIKKHYKMPRKRKKESWQDFNERKRREQGMLSWLGLKVDWRCEWCDYAWESCTPLDAEEVRLAEVQKDGSLVLTAEGRKHEAEIERMV
uniref:PD-(D/E)XK nuclease superfamily protein n=1 Tax=viral metagenome TaxID=1070528 RepID=A0A6M3JML1_9ZZZZ